MLCAGFAKVEITPPMGCIISGYYEERRGLEKLDPLYARAVAFSDGEKQGGRPVPGRVGHSSGTSGRHARADGGRSAPAAARVCSSPVRIRTPGRRSATVCSSLTRATTRAWKSSWNRRRSRALDDLKPAKMLYATGRAGGIAFIRRFRMRDGSTRTNPGYGNPGHRRSHREADEELRLVRISARGRRRDPSGQLPGASDTIGDCLRGADAISADSPALWCARWRARCQVRMPCTSTARPAI